VVAYEPTYLGGEEALVPVEAAAEAQERAVLQTPPIVGQAGQAITVDSSADKPDTGSDARNRDGETSRSPR
jgi:hypothetical protein